MTNAAVAMLAQQATEDFKEPRGFFMIEKAGVLQLSKLRGTYDLVFELHAYAKSLGKELNFSVREFVEGVYEVTWQPVDPPYAG